MIGSLLHIIGIRVGSTSLHLAMLFGLGALFTSQPWLHTTLKYLSIGYLVYLAYRICSQPVSTFSKANQQSAMTIKEAALFQWVNPKSWMAVMTLCSAFTLAGESYWLSAIAGVIVFNLVGFPVSFTWVLLGNTIAKKLTTNARQKTFNWTMGSLLLVCIPMLIR